MFPITDDTLLEHVFVPKKEVSKHREVEGEGDGKRRDGTRVAIQIERMKIEIRKWLRTNM